MNERNNKINTRLQSSVLFWINIMCNKGSVTPKILKSFKKYCLTKIFCYKPNTTFWMTIYISNNHSKSDQMLCLTSMPSKDTILVNCHFKFFTSDLLRHMTFKTNNTVDIEPCELDEFQTQQLIKTSNNIPMSSCFKSLGKAFKIFKS